MESTARLTSNRDCQFVGDGSLQLCSPAIAALDCFRSAVGVSLCACVLLQATSATAHDEGAFPEVQTTSSTTGAITGTITDGSGAVLPGATITISGAALIGPRTVVSGSEGLYRFRRFLVPAASSGPAPARGR